MIYAKIDNKGYIEYTVEATHPQEGLVEFGYDIGQSPGDWYSFNVNSGVWEDIRSEEQKLQNAAQLIIQKRNNLLLASDWTQLPDVPLATKENWAVYRQALRDITLQTGYPLNVVWPDRPQ